MTARPGLVLGSALALLLAGAAAGCYVRDQQAREHSAADQATLAAYRQTIDELLAQTARADTVFTADTVRFAHWRDRWDTVRLVDRITDTLVSVDTLRLVVAVADSTIAACSTALDTCEARDALRLQRIAADSGQLRALSRQLQRARRRGRLGCVVGPSVTTGGLEYVAVGCGLRIF